MATAKENHTPLQQRPGALAFAAAGTAFGADTAAPPQVPPSRPSLRESTQAAAAQAAHISPPGSCQQCLSLSFFFDGTGNNLDADVGTLQHSNVARLFQVRRPDDESCGRYSFYIPGLGTYFKDIGDPGNTARGRGFGHMGQERLDWAFAQFDKTVAKAAARAKNPSNPITAITVHVFGFSRGATAARAFVRDLFQRCEAHAGGYRLKQGGYPLVVNFLGLFDTVASVGLPMGANHKSSVLPLATRLRLRANSSGDSQLTAIAFGEPGADPAPGAFDGHASWADGLAVPTPFVRRALHLVAAHEIRNSFPLDSVLNGRRYPAGVQEMVYPGAHSDVGGGYQPGEGARSAHYGEMLSLIPLRVMHAQAVEAGGALFGLDAVKELPQIVRQSFALDDEGAKKFAELQAHYAHYAAVVGDGRGLGAQFLAHMALYLRWRFYNIRRQREAAAQGKAGPDQQAIAKREPQFAARRQQHDAEIKPLEEDWQTAQRNLRRVETEAENARYNKARWGTPIPADLPARQQRAQAEEAAKRDRYLRRKSERDTAADDSTLAASLAEYDAQLMRDAKILRHYRDTHPWLKLRPHYRNLVNAYEDEFIHGKGLRDAKLIAFFDRYVHDSLAGFATDATLPSDPRVIYVGGDDKLRFAGALDHPGSATLAA